MVGLNLPQTGRYLVTVIIISNISGILKLSLADRNFSGSGQKTRDWVEGRNPDAAARFLRARCKRALELDRTTWYLITDLPGFEKGRTLTCQRIDQSNRWRVRQVLDKASELDRVRLQRRLDDCPFGDSY